jgi:murein DD-endopeptidase MepM/ murein hydrolase activator NlpD
MAALVWEAPRASDKFCVIRFARWAALLLPLLLSNCVSDRAAARTDYAPAPSSYFTVRVQTGDSVSKIAQRYRVAEEDVLAMNDLNDRDSLEAGRALKVPAYGGGYRPRASSSKTVVRTSSTAPAVAPSSVPVPVARPAVDYAWNTPKATPIALRQPEVTQGSYGSLKFLWPLQGQVISSYGARQNGERNDGINIIATEGTAIRAAAAGTVSYAGNELKGYGNLVLIKHADGYVTAYAHASRITVERGQWVNQGQVIAYTGQTGDVARPQLHFEIRRGIQPVNPASYLVASN